MDFKILDSLTIYGAICARQFTLSLRLTTDLNLHSVKNFATGAAQGAVWTDLKNFDPLFFSGAHFINVVRVKFAVYKRLKLNFHRKFHRTERKRYFVKCCPLYITELPGYSAVHLLHLNVYGCYCCCTAVVDYICNWTLRWTKRRRKTFRAADGNNHADKHERSMVINL